MITPASPPSSLEKLEDILVQGRVLEPSRRVKFADVMRPEFAVKAR